MKIYSMDKASKQHLYFIFYYNFHFPFTVQNTTSLSMYLRN